MDIRSTISNELAEDVQNLLQKYLDVSEPTIKRKFVNVVSSILSGDESKISETAKYNIAKTGTYALTGLSLMTGVVSLADAVFAGSIYDNMTYNTQSLGLLTSLGIGLPAIVLHSHLKDLAKASQRELNELAQESYKEELKTSRGIPNEVKLILAQLDQGNITNKEQLISTLESIPKQSLEVVKELAWIHSNREQIRSGAAPIQHQYDPKPASPPKMRM